MGKTLQEQFLKAGLVDKKTYNNSKKEKHNQRKTSRQPNDEIADKAKQALAEKRMRDRQLNKKKIAERKVKEDAARARQLIDSHRIPFEPGNIAYNFKDESTIKKLYLGSKTIDSLAKGKIGIVKQAGEYHFVPADIIYKIRELNSKMVVLLNSRSDRQKDDDDPYAEYQIPDDLMW